jgi:hypothetical protein
VPPGDAVIHPGAPQWVSRGVLVQVLAAVVLLQGLTLVTVDRRPSEDLRLGALFGAMVAVALLGRLLHGWAERSGRSS